MDLENAKIEGQQLTVTLSPQLITRLRKRIPSPKLQQFIEKAIADQLVFEQEFASLEQHAHDWLQTTASTNKKGFTTEQDLSGWLEDIRKKMD